MHARLKIFCIALSAGVLIGCQKRPGPEKPAPGDFDIQGKVVAVASDKPSVTIDHHDIPGLMKAMQMEFHVSNPKVLEGIAPGDLVRGRLVGAPGHALTVTWLRKVDGFTSGDEDTDVQAMRAQLPAEERRQVEAQDFCAVADNSRLGSMGKPYKLTIKGQPVYLCCKSCEKEALAHPDKALARVEQLKAKNAAKGK